MSHLDDADWKHIGALLSSDEAAAVLGSTPEYIRRRAGQGYLLALRTSDGEELYPAFQFDLRSTWPGMAEVLLVFRRYDVNPWTVASWFGSPNALLKTSPAQSLREGRSEE